MGHIAGGAYHLRRASGGRGVRATCVLGEAGEACHMRRGFSGDMCADMCARP